MIREREIEDEALHIDCPVLVTERLVLRAPHDDDMQELAELANNRRVAEMLARMPHPYGLTEARAFIAKSRETRKAGCAYAVTLADSGAFIGCAGLNMTDRGLELGYWIGEPWWKRGYATEAAHATVDLAFRATVPTPHGPIEVERPARGAPVRYRLPPGVTAEIAPGASAELV